MLTDFDDPAYREVTTARREWFDRVYPTIVAATPVANAIEYACGVGVFTDDLLSRGLSVRGIDLRPENLMEARARHPTVTFTQLDFDACADRDFEELEMADMGFAMGIIYHLENPIGTLRRMCGRTRSVMVIETRTADHPSNASFLHEEPVGVAANTRRVVSVPTVRAVTSALHLGGFEAIYRPNDQPHHQQWNDNAGNGRRHNLVAFRAAMAGVPWPLCPVSGITKKWQSIGP